MPFKPNIPQPNDVLSDSQGDLLTNNQDLNTSFSVDHYAFDDVTANNGKHNQLTTPIISGGTQPTTASDEPKFFAFQPTTTVASPSVLRPSVLQYSRAGSDAIASPLTTIQSTVAAIPLSTVATDILDFSGMSPAYGQVSIMATGGQMALWMFTWTGAVLRVLNLGSSGVSSSLQLNVSSNKLTLTSLVSFSVYYTIEFTRINE